MTERLIKSTTERFSGDDIAIYVNEEYGTNYEDVALALVALGVSAVTFAIIPVLAIEMATLLSLGITTSTVVEEIRKAMESEDLGSVLQSLGGKDLKVTTKFYEWLSGSGNHTGYFSRVTFSKA